MRRAKNYWPSLRKKRSKQFGAECARALLRGFFYGNYAFVSISYHDTS